MCVVVVGGYDAMCVHVSMRLPRFAKRVLMGTPQDMQGACEALQLVGSGPAQGHEMVFEAASKAHSCIVVHELPSHMHFVCCLHLYCRFIFSGEGQDMLRLNGLEPLPRTVGNALSQRFVGLVSDQKAGTSRDVVLLAKAHTVHVHVPNQQDV